MDRGRWALGTDGPWAGRTLGMDGPPWALWMNGFYVRVGPRHGWALGTHGPSRCMCPGKGRALSMDGRWAWIDSYTLSAWMGLEQRRALCMIGPGKGWAFEMDGPTGMGANWVGIRAGYGWAPMGFR